VAKECSDYILVAISWILDHADRRKLVVYFIHQVAAPFLAEA